MYNRLNWWLFFISARLWIKIFKIVEAVAFDLCLRASAYGSVQFFYENGYFLGFGFATHLCGIEIVPTCLLAVKVQEFDDQKGFMV